MKRNLLVSALFIVGQVCAFSQPNLKEIIKIQSGIAGELNNAVEGFGKKISGEDIDYHSTRQDCPTALLVRSTDGTMQISWETPAISLKSDFKEIQLFLIAGMSLNGYDIQGVDPGFEVFVNDRSYFHFKNNMGENWTVKGPDGSRMIFETVIRDMANDGFGYARIVLPASIMESGKPVSVKIVGDASGTRHWFMVFQCPDGLDWFRKKSAIDGWFDLSLTRGSGNIGGILSAPETWAGESVIIMANDGKPQKISLIKKGGATTAAFAVPKGTTSVAFSGPGSLNIPEIDIATPQNKSVIQADRLISYQLTQSSEENSLIQVQIAGSTIASDLRNIANSQFSRGKILIMASSHQDIAWMDSPEACVEDRDVLLITPALKKLEENPLYYNDMEDILMLREYLTRHPEKKEEIYKLTKEGRLTWGASYMQPYEEMYFGEPLIRQFYLGRKWFHKEFPGCDANIYWNVDVPGRTLQMPQILAKSGVDYMIVSRHEQGLFNWMAADGSKILTYSPGHYYNSYVNLKKGFFESVQHFSELTDFWGTVYAKTTAKPVMPVLSDADMAVPDSYFDYIETWNSLKTPDLRLPELVHSTAGQFLDGAMATGTDFPTIRGERPAVWLYIHGPSHFEALKAGRSAGRLLPAAEKMAGFRSMVTGNWDAYPTDRLTKAWESAIYPDHGWGGKNGDITDQTFLDRFKEADEIAKAVLEETTRDIAGSVSFDKKGMPLVIFNSLSWERTDPVELELTFPDKTFKGIVVKDDQGKNIAVQVTAPGEYYASGYLKALRVAFIAERIPSLGYQTYYVFSGKKQADSARSEICPAVIKTDHYIIRMGKGGIQSLFDKDLQKEVLNTDQFRAGELFSMHSAGNGAGEFSDIQQPDMEGFEKPGIGPTWNLVEEGPVRMVVEGATRMKHNSARMTFIIYPKVKRIDVHVALIDWDGTASREFRLAFPAGLKNPEISYEVPFGVVRVGKDELRQAAGERYTTPCKDVHPRGINNWISASDKEIGITISSEVAVWDYVNMTNLDTDATLLQPVLLASRQSCHGEGPLYHQKGSHTMEFSLFSHQPGWENGYHQALQANEKLTAVFNPALKSPSLPERLSFLSVDDGNTLVSTVKKSEDDNSLIVRLFDQLGIDKTVKINLYRSPDSVEHTDLIEENGQKIPKDEKGTTVKIGHHSIETYKFRF